MTQIQTKELMRTKLILLALAAVALPAAASVQITAFNPPLSVDAFSDITVSNQWYDLRPLDFNLDGTPECCLAYGVDSFGFGGIILFLNAPAEVVAKQLSLDTEALPLNTVIGPNETLPKGYRWFGGYTNTDEPTAVLGDHALVVVEVPNVAPTGEALGLLGTAPPPRYPLVESEVVGKAGVMGIKFYLQGQPHYGYIQFDFRATQPSSLGSTGGVIEGWAYETEPNTAIKARPLTASASTNRPVHP